MRSIIFAFLFVISLTQMSTAADFKFYIVPPQPAPYPYYNPQPYPYYNYNPYMMVPRYDFYYNPYHSYQHRHHYHNPHHCH